MGRVSRSSPYSLETLPTNRQPPTPLPAPRMAGRARARAERRGGERPSPRLSMTVNAGLPDTHRKGGPRQQRKRRARGRHNDDLQGSARSTRQHQRAAAARHSSANRPRGQQAARDRPGPTRAGGAQHAAARSRAAGRTGELPEQTPTAQQTTQAERLLAAASPGGPPGVTSPPAGAIPATRACSSQ